jgi:ATP synthase subunit 6
MIISPLEQFNILSVYDFSLIQISSFEIIYAKLLLLIWNIFFNYPICVYSSICLFLSNNLPLFWIATNFFVVFYTTVLDSFLLFIYFFFTFIYKFSILIGLVKLYIIIDYSYYIYYFLLSFLWSILWVNLNFLYSFDHLFFFKIFDFFIAQPTAELTNGVNFSSGLGFQLEWNLLLACGSLGFFVVNLYFLFMEIGLSAWTLFYQIIIEKLFAFNVKNLSYFIFSLNTSTIWLMFGFFFLIFFFTSISIFITLVSKNRWQTLLEIFYDLILNVVNDNAGPNGKKFFPLIFTIFMIILICNVQGMIPYSFTVTSHSIVRFSLALAIFIGINILGIFKNRRHFFSLFFPPGAPLPLAPLLVFIELVSYVFRVLSLSIRLFANLMSGHTLLKILSGFAWAAVSVWGLFLIPLFIIFLVTGLESAIAFLQSYIFCVLLCIYINDAFNLH